MAGQDAGSRATKIPCSRYLLTQRDTCKLIENLQLPALPAAAHLLCRVQSAAQAAARPARALGQLGISPEKRAAPRTDAFAQAGLIASVSLSALVMLPAQVTPPAPDSLLEANFCDLLPWQHL